MFDIWEFINAEFAGKAQVLIKSLDATDPRILIVPIILAVYLSSKIVSGQPPVRRLGLRLGTAVFLIYGGYALYQVGSFDSKELPGVALRAANVGGLVLAVTWTFLPIATFVYAHLRLALAAFLAYAGYVLATEGFQVDQLSTIALRGLAVVGLVLVVAWILQPVWDFFRDLLPRRARRADPEGEEGEPRPGRRARRRRAAETRKMEPEVTVLSTSSPTLAVPPPVAPEQMEAQRRRDKARLQIEMAYVLALPRIGDRFPRAAFDDFVRRFLGDHLPPEDVEDHGRQLKEILDEHQRQAQEAPAAPVPASDAVIALVREEKVG